MGRGRPLVVRGEAGVGKSALLEYVVGAASDLSALPRMTAPDVVTATLAGIAQHEVVIAPGLEDVGLLGAVFAADSAAFHGQGTQLATRYGPARTATPSAGHTS